MATPRQQPPSSTSSRRTQTSNFEQEPDDVIGEFRRGKEIGKGSFATVFLAQHRKKKSFAAVKIVQMSKLTKKLKDNLDSEISILHSLKHPHIVAMFTCVERPAYIYLVMEYCQLSDLSQFMKKRQQLASFPETADIFRKYPNPENGGLHEVLSRHFLKQIASALQYLRGRNLIHRDIKPQNLLLNPSPTYMANQRPEDVPLAASEMSLVPAVGVETLPMLKIADFGFARHLPSTAMAETLCGSPLYMAPEILRYEKYDARADLWSTGTVLYEMVVGKPPFRAQNHVELLRRIEKAHDVITFDKNLPVSRDMKNAVRKLLKKSPLDRVSYEDFFNDAVVVGDIPGLVGEDRPVVRNRPTPDPEVSELSRRMAKQAIDAPAQSRQSPEPQLEPRKSHDENANRTTRRPSEQYAQAEEMVRRKSSSGGTVQETAPKEQQLQRQPSQRGQRRPSIVAHATAPSRQELHVGTSGAAAAAAPTMPRRASRSSPLAAPPIVHGQVGAGKGKEDTSARASRERTAQDVAFEKEYVVIEKRQVEVNAFADELDANTHLQGRGSPQHQGTMIRRATTQGQPTSTTGAQSSSPSRGMQVVTGRMPHQRGSSFERRYAPSPQSTTNMLTKALNAANVRLFGALGSSPPFGGKGPSPPRGYGAFPTYSTQQAPLLIGDGSDGKTALDEDSRIVRTMEEAAHRSDVIFGFAEVKYRQLLPATPSAQDGLGIQQLGHPDIADDEDKDMTTVAIVGVAEEALVLYVKTLAILAKTIDLAGYWWNKHSRGEVLSPSAASPRNTTVPAGTAGMTDVSKRMNNVVQWARSRFNECLEKSEIVGRRLVDAQKKLPTSHPGHEASSSASTGATSGAAAAPSINASGDHIQLTSGVTAEKLMFERAVEMSRASAVNELVGEDLAECELGYVTSIMLFEAVLEADDEPLMRKPSAAKKDRAVDELIVGMEGEDRVTVIKLIEGARARLGALRKKLAAAQLAQQAQAQPRRPSMPKSLTTGVSPGSTPAFAGTPPR